MSDKKKIAIIGAGAAGLSAAFYLSKDKYNITVFESAPFVGGQASTININGGLLERGYHHLFTNDYSIIQLMKDLNIYNKLIWYPSKVGSYIDGKTYSTTSPFDLLKLSALPILDRIKLGLFSIKIKNIKNWKSLEKYTANEWLQNNLGGQSYDKFWKPLLRAKFGDYYDQIGMPWFWSKMQTRFASRKGKIPISFLNKEVLGYPDGSFEIIFDELKDYFVKNNINLFLKSPVTKIIPQDNSSINLEYKQNNQINTDNFDLVLSTTPSFIFNKLVNLPSSYLNKLNSVKYIGALVMIIELEHKLTDHYWVNIVDNKIPFLGLIEHTNMLSRKTYGDKNIVYLTNYLDRDHHFFSKDKDQIFDMYIPHLKKFNPNFTKKWISNYHINTLSAAQPIIGTNYSQSIPSHQTPIKNLFLANTTQIYPEDRGTNYSIRMGKNLADKINKT
ncbi:MAG: amine oxidase [Chloroflexi bacterium]|nr:amine oxidase [Chloroflexota bacterium]